jgi:hypothetical protein
MKTLTLAIGLLALSLSWLPATAMERYSRVPGLLLVQADADRWACLDKKTVVRLGGRMS